MAIVTLINPFSVPKDKADEFVKNWTATTKVFSKPGSGLIETHMHKNIGGGDESFLFINIARWESTKAFQDAHASYTPGEEKMAGVKHHPGLFKAIADDVFIKAEAKP